MVLWHPCERSSSFFPTSFFQGIAQGFTNSTRLSSTQWWHKERIYGPHVASARVLRYQWETFPDESNPAQGKESPFFITGEQSTFLKIILLVTFRTQVFCLILASYGNALCGFVAPGLANLAVPSKSFWILLPSSVTFDRHWRLKGMSKWGLDTSPWSVAVGPGASPLAFTGYSLSTQGWRLTDVLSHSFVSHNLLS